MCVKNNLLVSWAVALSLVGMKYAILLNQSTTTKIASNPLDGGKLTMKSMDTLSHDPSRISNGHNNLVFFLIECLILLANQASLHVFLCIVFQIRPIVGLLKERCGALCATMVNKWPIMALFQEHIFKPPFRNIKPILKMCSFKSTSLSLLSET
jgi:hypothetical protein